MKNKKMELKKMTERQLMDEKNKRIRKLSQLKLDAEVQTRMIRRINTEQVTRLFGRELKFAKRGNHDA